MPYDITRQFPRTIMNLFEHAYARQGSLVTLNLGGTSGSGGGTGGPPGGFYGLLPQKYVTYDTTEAATSGSVGGSGSTPSLVDNLNRIRFWMKPARWFEPSISSGNLNIGAGIWWTSGSAFLDYAGGSIATPASGKIYLDSSGSICNDASWPTSGTFNPICIVTGSVISEDVRKYFNEGGAGGGTGDISGTGIVGRVAEFVTDTKTIQAANLIGPATNILTFTATAASTLALAISAGKALTLTAADNYNITFPNSMSFPANAEGYLKNTSGSLTWDAGVPVLTETYIGYGDGSNLLTGDADLTWSGTELTVVGSAVIGSQADYGMIGLGGRESGDIYVGLWRGDNNQLVPGSCLNLGGFNGIMLSTGQHALGSQTAAMTIGGDGSSQNVGIGAGLPSCRLNVYSTTAPQFLVGYDNSYYMTTSVDSTGAVTLATTGTTFQFSDYVGVGITPRYLFDVAGTGTESKISVQRSSGSAAAATSAAGVRVIRSRGETTGSPSAILSGDYLGYQEFAGFYDASNIKVGAYVSAIATENWEVNKYGTKMVWGATTIGAANGIDVLTLTTAYLSMISGTTFDALTDGATGGFRAGSTADVLFYRGAANTWQTPDSVSIDVGLNVGTATGAAAGQIKAIRTAAASGAENIFNLTVSDDATSYLNLENALSTDNVFSAAIVGGQSSTYCALVLMGKATTDTGTIAVMRFDSRMPGGAIATRPTFNWLNYGTVQMSLSAASGLAVVGGFGCNAKAAQTAYVSGGAVAYTAGTDHVNDARLQLLYTLVANIRLALVADGIMS